MCGIAGIILGNLNHNQNLKEIIIKLITPLKHRGPDAFGYWIDNDNRLALGHTRLAILDPSPKANQPLLSYNKKYVISYNGEIYNFKDLALDLQKKNYNINYNSDTEVILNYIEAFGLDVSLKKFNGMFAIALFDITNKILYLIRDRIGVKPLYYAWANDGSFLFASELKSIMQYDSFDKEIDLHSLSLYFSHNYIPSPFTIFKKTYKLNPGEILEINLFNNKNYHIKKYWSILSELETNREELNENDAISLIHNTLKKSVKLRTISDMPVGVFLSGGIDSTLITAILSTQQNKINTFSIGFYETDFNEATYAKEIAKYLNTNHHEIYITPEDAKNLIYDIPFYYDEPFSDSSQIPTLLLSKYASNYVKVILSGDGGDELFAGYTRYLYILRIWKYLKFIPNFYKPFLSKLLLLFSNLTIIKIIFQNRLILKKYNLIQIFRRLSEIITYKDFPNFYIKLCSHFLNCGSLIKNHSISTIEKNFNTNLTPLQTMSIIDLLSYLPDDILTKMDRGSMAFSIEAREPYLDVDLVRFAINLPDEFKLKNNNQKWILKQILKMYLPEELFSRPKRGFSIPLSLWLNNQLKKIVDEIIYNGITYELKDLLNTNIIYSMWSEHKKNIINHQYVIWSIVVFLIWYHKWIENKS